MFLTELFFLALTFSLTWVNINISDLREQLTALCSSEQCTEEVSGKTS